MRSPLHAASQALCAATFGVGGSLAAALGAAGPEAVVPAQTACESAPAPSPPLTSTLALATFDSAWSLIHNRHFDTTFNGVDWQALGRELRPRAGAAGDVEALRAVIRDMLGRLGQSHFAVIPREASPDPETPVAAQGETGIVLRVIGRDALVAAVDSGSPADRAGVRAGWIVLAVDGCPIADLAQLDLPGLAPRAARRRAVARIERRLDGDAGSSVRLSLADASGVRHDLLLERAVPLHEMARFGGLPPTRATIESRRVEIAPGASVGIVRFSVWLPVLSSRLDAAVEWHRRADGFVLDLRGNPGGVGGMVMGLAGHFLATPDTLGTMRMRDQRLHFVSNPRRVSAAGVRVEPLDAPLAILVDETTGSTSEVFAGALQALGRARIFGDTTAGAVLPAVTQRLPNGDVLYHAIADFALPAGTRLEGRGVAPDVIAPPTRQALIAGRDDALDAALHWLASEIRSR
ncbi:MAG TPA: S41 family peptidase [Gemmatimonadaceae bacterium]|nr:S41 family peptidase [Gemmatimonadaceae bacterium]